MKQLGNDMKRLRNQGKQGETNCFLEIIKSGYKQGGKNKLQVNAGIDILMELL